MAVYTEVTPAELAQFITRFGLGNVRDLHGITQGVENTNYRVDTDKGRYLLTLFEKRVDANDLPFFLGLMDHLAKRGLNCPVPVRDGQGEILGQLAGRPAALVSWLEGAWPKTQTAAQCEALGHALAELHIDGRDFTLTRANALGLSGWRPLFDRFAPDADTITPGLHALIATELDDLERHWPKTLPQGVIHADLFPDNAFFVGDTLTGIFDFYFACNDALAYDVAVCLNAWCFDASHAFASAKAEALMRGYTSVRPLDAAELAALPILARGAALRFLLTRAHDWIHTPPDALVQRKDPGEYVQKLRFHQSVTSSRTYGATG